MKHKIRVYLRLLEFEDSPDEVINYLGIIPTKAWKKGDVISERTGKQSVSNGLEFIPSYSNGEDFETQLLMLVTTINSRLDEFIEICKKCYTEVACVIYLYSNSEESVPAVHLDKQTMETFAKLGAEIDIDLYVLSGSGKSD